MKKKRIINQDLIDYIKNFECIICRKSPVDADHLITRGAGGDDIATNLWGICRHHHVERHAKGLGHMVRNYRACRIWLWLAGRTDILEKHLPDFNLPSR